MWVRIDDQVGHHPKFIAAGPVAAWLWVCGCGYCSKYLTDGFISTAALKTLGGVTKPQKWAHKLVEVGLWVRVAGGYRVHDYHDYNPTAEAVKTKREQDRARKKNGAAAS